MQILFIQHCPVTPAGLVAEIARQIGAEVAIAMPHRGDPLPGDGAGIDGLVVLGGPMHAGDDEGYPAFAQIMELIGNCHRRETPILGLCLGAQLIARALGGAVRPMGKLEVGYPEVEVTEAGARDPLLRGLARRQRIMQMHEDSFDLPDGAVLLMRNDFCENQAFRVGRVTYGIQAHPEVTLSDARSFPRDCWAAMERHFGEAAEIAEARAMAEIEAHYQGGAAFCRVVSARWLKLARANARSVKSTGRKTARHQARAV
jgi:GMP synthase-like glutamine amidotransferase